MFSVLRIQKKKILALLFLKSVSRYKVVKQPGGDREELF